MSKYDLKKELTYHDNDYFNVNDLYIIETSLGTIKEVKCELYNGYYYSLDGGYKMTTVKSIKK